MDRKPIGTLPPRRDSLTEVVSARNASQPQKTRPSDSIIVPQARDRLMELIEREQFPEDVRQTLAGALTGDLARQALLFQAMVDTWPRLSKCLAEVQRQMQLVPWVMSPHLEKGKDEPTSSAKERMEFCENAFQGMKPRPAYNDSDSETLIEDLAMGYFFGHQVSEISWKRSEAGIIPEFTKAVSARFYGYPQTDEGEDRLMLRREGQVAFDGYEDFPPHKFLIGINKAHPGHPSVAAPLRALAQYWLAATFGLKWMFQFTQLFGVPFRWATYGDNDDEAKVCQMLEKIGSAGYAAFKSGTKLEFVEASKGSTGSLPQETLLSLADRQCEIFILGQSLTSDVGDSGSRALGEVHNEVRLDVMQGIANHVAKILNCQFFPSILALNYGDEEEAPSISATFAPSKDEQKRVERDRILFKEMGLPVSKDYLYERHEVPIPKNGDKLFLNETEGEEIGASHAGGMEPFGDDFETLGIPRSEMPQIDSGNRSAFIQFLRKKGIGSEKGSVPAKSLMPTQQDFSREKVEKSKAYVGGSRSILVSSDNRVLDGHHQWLASFEKGESVPVLRLDAPMVRLLQLAHRMPSSTVAAMRGEEVSTIEELSSNVLEGLTGVSKEWLAGVRPHFDRLAALAESGEVSDGDFIDALTKAQEQLPELFDELDTEALEEAFTQAIGTGMLSGSVSRFEEQMR